MKQKFYSLQLIACIAILTATSGCHKDASPNNPGNGNNAPRKPVPASLVGSWRSTQVSGSVINYPGGRNEPTWASGIAFDFHADGTGICVASYETHGPASETYSRVDQDCTFDISIDDNNVMTLTFYVVKGKVYENNVFLHDLEPSKCWPAKSFTYTCSFGENSNGTFFQNGNDVFFKS